MSKNINWKNLVLNTDNIDDDFTHQLEKDLPEIHFQGKGVLDRVENGRVYGRLDDGRTFTCFFNDVVCVGEGQ